MKYHFHTKVDKKDRLLKTQYFHMSSSLLNTQIKVSVKCTLYGISKMMHFSCKNTFMAQNLYLSKIPRNTYCKSFYLWFIKKNMIQMSLFIGSCICIVVSIYRVVLKIIILRIFIARVQTPRIPC